MPSWKTVEYIGWFMLIVENHPSLLPSQCIFCFNQAMIVVLCYYLMNISYTAITVYYCRCTVSRGAQASDSKTIQLNLEGMDVLILFHSWKWNSYHIWKSSPVVLLLIIILVVCYQGKLLCAPSKAVSNQSHYQLHTSSILLFHFVISFFIF